MIIDRPMTPEESERSRKRYLNASYLACCANVFSSGTIFMLLVLALGASGEFSAAVGAFQLSAYLLLPFGFSIAAKMGVCRSTVFCTLGVAFCCVLLVFSGFLPTGGKYLAIAGTILICLPRSLSTAMVFPLQKNIYPGKLLVAFQQKTATFAHICTIGGTLLVAFLLKGETSPVKISMTIIPGIILFLFECDQLWKMDEPAILQKMAAHPIIKEVRLSWRNAVMRKQLITGVTLNLYLASLLQVNLIAAKNGMHVSDSEALILTVILSVFAIAGSIVCRVLSQKIGPRNTMLWTYPLYWIIPASWLFIPDGASWYAAVIPFAVSGFASCIMSISLGLYFMMSIPNRLQVGGSFLIYVVTGGMAGIAGICLNSLFFRIAGAFGDLHAMSGFHYYYLAAGIFFFCGFLSILNIPVKYREYKERKVRKA